MARREFEVETAEVPERAVLIGIERPGAAVPAEESLAELERLAHTAGAETVFTMSQRLDAPNPRTFIGSGKAEELASIVRNMDIDVVIFDDELSPSQQSKLEELVGRGVKVIDRTALILDIFALHATSRAGRLQVKLAQNRYLLPRLRGMWSHLAAHRMGGGVGSRFGEGESQLEVDRRLVRHRIEVLRRELASVEKSRDTQRKERTRSGVFRIVLAGYTNAGKSTLMNRLTGADVLAYDKLFATLDSTTRRFTLPQGTKATLTDTVGFIQKLPHSLVESFKSTLDEVREADLAVVVVDASSAMCADQLDVVCEVLAEIDADKVRRLVCFNKMDMVADAQAARLRALHPDAVFASARDGVGVDALVAAIEAAAQEDSVVMDLLVPFGEAEVASWAHEHVEVLSQEYRDDGIALCVRIPHGAPGSRAKLEPYMVRNSPVTTPMTCASVV